MKWPKLKTHDLIEVLWNDIVSVCVWMPLAEAEVHDLIACRSVGHYLNRNDGALRIYSTINSLGDCDVQVIPVSVIGAVKKLRKVK